MVRQLTTPDRTAQDQATERELLGGVPTQRTPLRATAPKPVATAPVPVVPPVRRALRRPVLHLLPTPTGTPFTFAYILVLTATSLFMEYGDPATVSSLLRASSTDVAHLAHTPVLVLGASALWVSGGLVSPYTVAFVFVLTALERRIGGLRAAGVFMAGHVAVTLATEIPVGLWVLAGQLPATSLHRLDYGISFGLLTCVGALAAVLSPVVRGTLLGFVSLLLLQDLLAFADPLTNWGHLLALPAGIACGPVVRHWAAARGHGATTGGGCRAGGVRPGAYGPTAG